MKSGITKVSNKSVTMAIPNHFKKFLFIGLIFDECRKILKIDGFDTILFGLISKPVEIDPFEIRIIYLFP